MEGVWKPCQCVAVRMLSPTNSYFCEASFPQTRQLILETAERCNVLISWLQVSKF